MRRISHLARCVSNMRRVYQGGEIHRPSRRSSFYPQVFTLNWLWKVAIWSALSQMITCMYGFVFTPRCDFGTVFGAKSQVRNKYRNPHKLIPFGVWAWPSRIAWTNYVRWFVVHTFVENCILTISSLVQSVSRVRRISLILSGECCTSSAARLSTCALVWHRY